MRAVNLKEAARALDFREYIEAKLGDDLEGIDVLYSEVLLATFILPEKTAGGIIRPDENIRQDVFQGKIGLILKMGETAYKYMNDYSQFPYEGVKPQIGDYVMCHASDPRELAINGVSCKLVDASRCKLRVKDPYIFY